MLSKRRRVDEEFRAFEVEWENNLVFVNHVGRPTYLIFTESIQARSQKFAMGGVILGLGAETPAAVGQWGLGAKQAGGLGAKSPAARGTGV